MSEIRRAIPYDTADQAIIGGGYTAKSWNEESSLIARTKGPSAVTISFATSGSASNPTDWTTPINLGTGSAGELIPSSYLAGAINANITLNGARIVIVEIVYADGEGQYEALINNSWEDFIYPV